MAPIQSLWRSLISYYSPKSQNPEPAIISPAAAAGLSIIYTLVYVLPFYLSSKTRPSPQLPRDAPSVIRARIRVVTFSCTLMSLMTIYLSMQNGRLTAQETMQLLGWWPIVPVDIIKTLALVVILFLGPLFEGGIAEGKLHDWISARYLPETLGSWIGWRNYVAGPVTEEIAFRSALVPLHVLAQMSSTKIIFLTPLYFGIAHVHHFYEYYLTHPHTPLLPILSRSLFQFTYTSLFGFYATFVYLRTGSLLSCILAHSFCNWMGLPRFWGRVEAPVMVGPPDVKKKEAMGDEASMQVAQGRLGIGWTIVYYLLLVAGAAGFYVYLWPLTESSRALMMLHKPR